MGQAVLQAIASCIHHDWPVEMFANKAATPHPKRTAKQPQFQTFIIPQGHGQYKDRRPLSIVFN